MKKFLYGAIYFFVLAMIFKGFLTGAAGSVGIDLPTAQTILVSKNGGKDWEKPKTKGENINGEKFFFNTENPSEVFLASNKGIILIENEQTFDNKNADLKKTLGGEHVSEFIQDIQSPNIFYIVSDGMGKSNLFVSYNYGNSFKSIFTVGNNDKISVFRINPVDSSYLYIGTKNGLFLSSNNGGSSWHKNKSFSPSSVKEISISVIEDEIYISLSSKIVNLFSSQTAEKIEPAVYISRNGGNSFSAIKELKGHQINKIAVDDNSRKVYFISDYKIFIFKRKSFSSLNLLSSMNEEKIGAFTIDPKNSNILYIGIGNILYKTEDGGASWSVINVPTTGRKINDIKINEEDSNTILLSISN